MVSKTSKLLFLKLQCRLFCLDILVMHNITTDFAIYAVYIISILKSRRLIWTGHIYQCTERNI